MYERIWDVPVRGLPALCCEPRLVTREQVDRLVARRAWTVIASGANVPFADPEIFYGPIAEHADNHVSVIPDFIANCGMARVFAYCMQEGALLTDQSIFQDVSDRIAQGVTDAPWPNGILAAPISAPYRLRDRSTSNCN
jgi:glutamate dehydrogenase/leucine dehydrogenase